VPQWAELAFKHAPKKLEGQHDDALEVRVGGPISYGHGAAAVKSGAYRTAQALMA
jgi:hypothetical protein